jgi:hypothetical protein
MVHQHDQSYHFPQQQEDLPTTEVTDKSLNAGEKIAKEISRGFSRTSLQKLPRNPGDI